MIKPVGLQSFPVSFPSSQLAGMSALPSAFHAAATTTNFDLINAVIQCGGLAGRRWSATKQFLFEKNPGIRPIHIHSDLEVPQKIPEPVIKKAVVTMYRRHRINATERGFKFVAEDDGVFLLKHSSGPCLAIELDAQEASYFNEHYFRNLGAYFYEGILLKTDTEVKTDKVELLSIEGLGRKAFAISDSGSRIPLYSGYIPDLRVWIEHGQVYDAIELTPGFSPYSGYPDRKLFEATTLQVMQRGSGEIVLLEKSPDGNVKPVRSSYFPGLNLASDRNGFLHYVRASNVEGTRYYLGVIPDITQHGEFEYDGSGWHENIRVFHRELDGSFRDADSEEISSLVEYNEDSIRLMIERFDKNNESVYGNFPNVSSVGSPAETLMIVPAAPGFVSAFMTKIKIESPAFETTIRVFIEAANRPEFESKLQRLMKMISDSHISLLRRVRKIEVFDRESTSYRRQSVKVSGVCSEGGDAIELYNFKSSDEDNILTTLQHELWHSIHGTPPRYIMAQILLGIKAGSDKESSAIMSMTNSTYYRKTWAEYVAEAGPALLKGGNIHQALSQAPMILSALSMIVDVVELDPLPVIVAKDRRKTW